MFGYCYGTFKTPKNNSQLPTKTVYNKSKTNRTLQKINIWTNPQEKDNILNL